MTQVQNLTESTRRIEQIRQTNPAVPPTAQVMAVMRLCGPDLGLSPQVLRTLEVLLGCLAPKRNHHVVFASNATLVARAGGLSERSIRRHIAQLIYLDLAERADSANGKRYSRHDPLAGMTLRFGLDFSKLFARMEPLTTMAAEAEKRNQRLRYLSCKLRAACQRILQADPDNQTALAARTAARRKLSETEYEAILGHLPPSLDVREAPQQTADMASTGGQNDRHQSRFSKEHIEEKTQPDLPTLLRHCTEAQSFAVTRIKSAEDVIEHAERLAPMIGITTELWKAAMERCSRLDLAASVWLVLQNLKRILKPAAYFRSITTGNRAESFSPWDWLQRQSTTRCPRTI